MSAPNSCVTILLAEPARNPRTPAASAILAKKGYRLVRVTAAKEVVAQARQVHPALVVLDCSMGGSYALVCHDLCKECPNLPILLIAEESGDGPALPLNVSLLTPPFTARKLLNRVMRLLPQSEANALQMGDLVLYVQRRSLRCGGVEHRLTPMQVRLLEVFMRHPHEVLSRRFLIKEVWNTDYLGDTRTLDVHIRWLRQLIEDDPSHPRCIVTVRGVGYRFGAPETSKT